MKKAFILFAFLPLIVAAQSGVHFEEGLTWQQAKAKARSENKYIFVDCFATWCGPCKMMNRDVFTKDSIGQISNKDFISIKVQFDTTKSDNEYTRSWYADAHQIMTEYKIGAFPTFLFLSPDAKILHRGVGYQSSTDFARLLTETMNPQKQYYTLLRNYEVGERNYALMPYLAETAKKFNQTDISLGIATDYMRNYMDKLPDSIFCTKENLSFVERYSTIITSHDRVASFFFYHQRLVDSIMRSKGYSDRFVDFLIYKEVIAPRLVYAKGKKEVPDWNQIRDSISSRFGSIYVNRNVLKGKVNYYRSVQDWKNYCKYLVEKLEKDSIENSPRDFWGAYSLNNNAWDIFQHSKNKKQLKKALAWSDLAVQIDNHDPGNMDTKANLLYKLGNKEAALTLEGKAVELAPKNKDIQLAYQRMRQGEPTW